MLTMAIPPIGYRKTLANPEAYRPRTTPALVQAALTNVLNGTGPTAQAGAKVQITEENLRKVDGMGPHEAVVIAAMYGKGGKATFPYYQAALALQAARKGGSPLDPAAYYATFSDDQMMAHEVAGLQALGIPIERRA
jgi:hypothetical protein